MKELVLQKNMGKIHIPVFRRNYMGETFADPVISIIAEHSTQPD